METEKQTGCGKDFIREDNGHRTSCVKNRLCLECQANEIIPLGTFFKGTEGTLSSRKGYGEGSKKTQFKKGYTPWNFKGGKKLKRKYKRFNGKLILRSHYVWLNHNNLTKIPKGYVIHHKDGDSLNDEISNLILMGDIEHKRLQKRKVEEKE